MKKEGLTVGKLTKELINKLQKREFKYKDLKTDNEVCKKCFVQVWEVLLYKYRVSIKSKLPESVNKRSDCWYGKECRTQKHDKEHAKTYNHICENTKKSKNR